MLIQSGTRIAQSAMCLALIVGVSACAGTREPPYPIPDEPGIYAFTTRDDLRRLDGDQDWEVETWPERSNMPSNVQFVISEPALRSASNVELWRVAWVRSDINAQGQAMPVDGSEWAVAPMESFAIPFRYETTPDEPGVVHIAPTTPLTPGLYTLRVTGARQARIGVAWNGVDHREYSAMNCVDRYPDNTYRTCSVAVGTPTAALPAPDPSAAGVTSNGGLASLSAPQPVVAPAPVPAPSVTQPTLAQQPAVAQPTVTQPTATQQAATPPVSAQGLQISLVDPVRRNDGLIVQGVVINTSNQVRAIPTMQGSLETAAGQEVRRWQFQPPVKTLGPGERAAFATEVRPVPAGVSRASVAFIASSR
jgi:hypothetical protein